MMNIEKLSKIIMTLKMISKFIISFLRENCKHFFRFYLVLNLLNYYKILHL